MCVQLGIRSTEGVRRTGQGDSWKTSWHPRHVGSDTMSCKTATDAHHAQTCTFTQIDTRPRKSQAHSSEQQLQGRKWGQST